MSTLTRTSRDWEEAKRASLKAGWSLILLCLCIATIFTIAVGCVRDLLTALHKYLRVTIFGAGSYALKQRLIWLLGAMGWLLIAASHTLGG